MDDSLFQGPYDPQFLQDKEDQLGILSQITPGDRQGLSPEFTPEQIEAEANSRATNMALSRIRALRDVEDSKAKAEASKRDMMGLPAAPVVAPGVPVEMTAPQPSSSEELPVKMSYSKKTREQSEGVPSKGADASPAPASQPQDYLQNLLNKVYGDGLGDKDIKAAQEKRDQTQLFANLSKAGSMIGAGLSKGTVKANTDVQDSIIKGADQPVEDIMTRRKAKGQEMDASAKASEILDKEKLRDPGSSVSAAYRDFAAQASPELARRPDFNNLSAEGVKQLLPGLDMLVKSKMLKAQKEEAAMTKQAADTDKRFSQASKVLASELAGNRTAFGKAAGTYASAEKLQQLVANRDPNDLDRREVGELARALDNILSNGSPTVSGMKKLMPESARASAEGMAEWLFNERRGARLGSFVSQVMHTVEREKDLAKDQIARTQGRILTGYSDLKDKDTPRWKMLLQSHDLPEDILEFKKKPEQSSAATVLMRAPDGRTIKVPKDKVKDALAAGGKLVQ